MKLPNTLSMSPLKQLINWLARPYDFLDDCAKSYGDLVEYETAFGFKTGKVLGSKSYFETKTRSRTGRRIEYAVLKV